MSPVNDVNAVVNEFGRIETNGVEFIPHEVRKARPRDMLWVFLSANINFSYIIIGSLLVVMGLSPMQALLVLLVAGLFWIIPGILAASGPVAGSPAVVVTRALYGVRGNKVLGAALNWFLLITYEGLNVAVATFAVVAFGGYLGLEVSTAGQLGIAAVLMVLVFSAALFGHATVVRLATVTTYVTGAAIILLGIFLLPVADFGADGAGAGLPKLLVAGVALIVYFPLSLGIGADYSRYIPADVPAVPIIFWTGLGGAIATTIQGFVGVMAATAVDPSDLAVTLEGVVPGWFYVVLLFIIVASNVLSTIPLCYSAGLMVQGMGVRVRRVFTTPIDAVAVGLLCLYGLLSAQFLDVVSNVVALAVIIVAPASAIYAVDVLKRRNHYDPVALHDETSRSSFWYQGGVNVTGAVALVVGIAAGMLCAKTTLFTGPVFDVIGYDIAPFVGIVVGGSLYLASWWGTASARRTTNVQAKEATEAAGGL